MNRLKKQQKPFAQFKELSILCGKKELNERIGSNKTGLWKALEQEVLQ